MRLRQRLVGWTLVAVIVVSTSVIVPTGALLAAGTGAFNTWLGWAAVVAVPLAGLGLLLPIMDKVHGARSELASSARDELTDRTARPADAGAQTWSLNGDPEAEGHWEPRGRGVTVGYLGGHRFKGRTRALTEIRDWMGRSRLDGRILVVTGSPGTGKSAVLSRIVSTADPDLRQLLPADDEAVRAAEGSVACAVHATGKTANEVAAEIARAASLPAIGRPEELAGALQEVLDSRGAPRFNLIVDGLDEAADVTQVRGIITMIIRPLADACAIAGAQVIVGTRRRDSEGNDLMRRLGEAINVIDLDRPDYFEAEDLRAYAQATLQLQGSEEEGSPYQDDSLAEPVAARIAEMSDRNFLVAGLTALDLARSPGPVDPAELTVTSRVEDAFASYLERIPVSTGGVQAGDLLLPLAFAQAPGLPAELWAAAVYALSGEQVTPVKLANFARSAAANFLIESSVSSVGISGQGPTFRLFHQALNDTLLASRAERFAGAEDQHALTRAFVAFGRERGWDGNTLGYLWRSLPYHAAAAGLLDELFTDPGYLAHADLDRLKSLDAQVTSPQAKAQARLLRLTPEATLAGPAERRAMFTVTETIDQLGHLHRGSPGPLPYLARWAAIHPRTEVTTFLGHTKWVRGVCAYFTSDGPRLASASEDGTARIWDPATGVCEFTLTGHPRAVNSVCAYPADDGTRLATGGDDEIVRIWNPATGICELTLPGHQDWVNSVCAYQTNDGIRLATGGRGGTVRIWNPATGTLERTITAHHDQVLALCAWTTPDGPRLATFALWNGATGSFDRTVRIWNPATGTREHTLTGPHDWALEMCAYTSPDGPRLVTAGTQGVVRIWDPATGVCEHMFNAHTGHVAAMCAYTLPAGLRLATVGDSLDSTIRIWDLATGTCEHTLAGLHISLSSALCAYMASEGPRLAIAAHDATVRVWDPDADGSQPALTAFHGEKVRAICAYSTPGDSRIAAVCNDRMTIWDPATGTCERTITSGDNSSIFSLCAYATPSRDSGPYGRQAHAETRIATGSSDGKVRIWDPATGTCERTITSGDTRGAYLVHEYVEHPTPEELSLPIGWVRALCSYESPYGPRLAACSDLTVRIWDPITGIPERTLTVNRGLGAVCFYDTPDGPRLAAGCGATAEIWDLGTGTREVTLPGHDGNVCAVSACTTSVGLRLITAADDDCTVRIWDPAARHPDGDAVIPLYTLAGHSGRVTAVCAYATSSGPRVVTGSTDRTIRIWDPATGNLRQCIGVYHEVLSLAAIPVLNRGEHHNLHLGTHETHDASPACRTESPVATLAVGTDVGLLLLDLLT